MNPVAYSSPFVPAEWIAAHGLQPRRMLPAQADGASASLGEGTCSFAQAFCDELAAGGDFAAAIFATTCDQMRRSPELLSERFAKPIFLMNVPATWGDRAAEWYRAELLRLGAFLVRVGGREPSKQELVETMLAYDEARRSLLAARATMSARAFVEGLFAPRSLTPACGEVWRLAARLNPQSEIQNPKSSALPLALVGGPLTRRSLDVLDLIEQFGGQVALDATETGERTLPAPLGHDRLDADPLAELVRIYFGSIPDAFRRPNTMLYDYLACELPARAVRGIVFVRHVWCDLWHAELARLRQWTPLPVLELDISGAAGGSSLAMRVQSFLEVLR